jgi:DNA ligase-1
MYYSELAEIYQKIETTTKRLEMTQYLVELFKITPQELMDKVIYLTQGKIDLITKV